MAHAFASKKSSALQMEICSVMGTAHAQAEEGAENVPSSDSAPGAHLEHCPFCLGHAASAAPPPCAQLILPALASTASFPFLYYQAPHRLFIWSAALSRAPPVLV